MQIYYTIRVQSFKEKVNLDRKSKIFRIKIKNVSISVSIDSSYLAENIYNKEFHNMLNGKHYHAWQEVFFIEDEPFLLYCNDEEYRFSNCILCIPSMLEHCTIRKEGYRITFSYKLYGKGRGKCFLDEIFPENKFVSLPLTPNIIRYANEICKHFFEANDYSDEIIESFLKLIFCEMAQMGAAKKKKSRMDESYLDKIENMLFDFQSDINLGTLAEKLGLSTRQTSRILRKNYNATFSDMICERRLDIAGTLLKNTDMTVAEIVEYINFPSESYFYSKFKEKYKMTPASFRETREHY